MGLCHVILLMYPFSLSHTHTHTHTCEHGLKYRSQFLTFMEPSITRCVFYITNEMQRQFKHIHTSSRQQESMTIPKAARSVLLAPDDGRENRPKYVEH